MKNQESSKPMFLFVLHILENILENDIDMIDSLSHSFYKVSFFLDNKNVIKLTW